MNQVVAQNEGGKSVVAAGLPNNYLKGGTGMGANPGTFLKFSGNTGEWTFGRDGELLEEGTQLAVFAPSLRRGWICWKDGKVVDEIMETVESGVPVPESEKQLTDHGPYEEEMDGWSQQASVQLRSLDDGEEFLFKTMSKSGVMTLGRLAITYGKNMGMKIDEDGESLVPIIEIGTNSFQLKNKALGTKYAPTMKVVDWMSNAELQVMSAPQAKDDYEDDDDYEVEDEAPATEEKEEERKGNRRGRRGKNF